MARPKLNTVTLDYTDTEGGLFLIDIPHGLSLLNRKSFRSGYVYSVDFVEYIGAANSIVTLAKIPENYNSLGAYRLGYELWKEQRAESISETGIEPGRWSDFKPFYNQEHMNGTMVTLYPRGMGGGLILQPIDLTGSEWNRAEIVVNDHGAGTTATHQVGMLGADDLPNNYGSLIEAWGDTRAATLSPDPVQPGAASGSWITRTGEASAQHVERVVNLIEDENDQPPYANIVDPTADPSYIGNSQSATHGMMMDYATAGTTGRSVSLDGGLVPLGLIAVAIGGTDPWHIRVHVTRGTYKGAVAALPMGDFS